MIRRAMRIFFRWVLPIAGLALAIYLIAAEWLGSNSVLVGLLSTAGASILIELIFFGIDRLAPMDKGRQRDTTPVSEQTYIDDRLAFFEREKDLFVPLAGEALIETRFDAFREGFEAGEDAPQPEGIPYDDILKVADERGFERFVLVGDPGAGKTTSLRKLFAEASPKRPPLPLWIDLGNSANPADAEELIDYWWHEQYGLSGDPRQRNIWLFLDGLNEMPGTNPGTRAKSLQEWLASHPETRAVVTCRVRDYEGDLKLGLPVVRLDELNPKRIKRFTQRRLKPDQVEPFQEIIAERPNLQAIARNPYNLVMMLDLYRNWGRLPDNLYELYQMYLELRYEDYTEKRKEIGHTRHVRLPWKRLHRKLERLAFHMIDKGRGTIASERWAQRQIGRRALHDGFDMGVLVQEENIGTVRFFHQSLQGYFASKGLTYRFQVGLIENISGFIGFVWPIYELRRGKDLIETISNLPDSYSLAIQPLIHALANENKTMRRHAAAALGEIGAWEATEPLIHALRDRDRVVRRRAAIALGKLDNQSAVEPLIHVLRERDSSTRQAAAIALGHIGDPTAVEPLIHILGERGISLRLNAAIALGRIGNPAAVEPLIHILVGGNLLLRQAAAIALGNIGNSAAVKPLVDALGDRYRAVRWLAANALGEIGDPAAVPGLVNALHDRNREVRWHATRALRGISDPAAVEPLIFALRDKDSKVCASAAEALGEIGDPAAIEPLMLALRDKDSKVHRDAIEALGEIGDPAAIEPLILTLQDTWAYSSPAIEALRKIGDSAVEPLIQALHDKKHWVRLNAAQALGEIGAPAAVEPLIQALQDVDRRVRTSAAEALGEIGDPAAVEPLILALQDADRRADTFTRALINIGDPAIEPLIQALRDKEVGVRYSATEALGYIGNPAAIDALIQVLGDADKDIRRSAIRALGHMGASAAVEPLIRALTDTDSEVRASAAEALRGIGDPVAVDPLIQALRDTDIDVRASAATALGTLGDMVAVEPLIEALRDKNSTVRASAATALGMLGNMEAVEPLTEALHDKNWRVRDNTAQALENIGTSKAIAAVEAWWKQDRRW